MKNLTFASILAGLIVLSGCQSSGNTLGQRTVEESPAPLQPLQPSPVVSAGTCAFDSKSGRQTITTTYNDCIARGGNFIQNPPLAYPAPGGYVAPAPGVYQAPTPVGYPATTPQAPLIDSSAVRVETL